MIFSKSSLISSVILAPPFLFLFSFLGPVVYTAWGEEEVDRRQVIQEIVNVYTYTDKDGKEIADYSSCSNMGADSAFQIGDKIYTIFEGGVAYMDLDGKNYGEISR